MSSTSGVRGFGLAAGLLCAAVAPGAQAKDAPKESPGAKMIFLNPATGGLISADPGGGGTKPKPPARSHPLSNNANPPPKAKPPRPPVIESSSPLVAAPATNLGLRYWIDLMDSTGDHHEVTRDRVFHSSERIQLRFQTNMNGYIALYQVTSNGKVALLFPDKNKQLDDNRIDRGHPRALPREDAWFRFDESPGTERLFVLFARATEELELLLAERLLDHGPGVLPPGDQIASKDLILEMAPDATYAVNPAGAPIELESALRHE